MNKNDTQQKTKPTHYAKVRYGKGPQASYEQIGAAWDNGDGSLYVRLHGTQIVQGGFSLYPVNTPDES